MLLFTNNFLSINHLEVQKLTTFHFSNEAKKLNEQFLKADIILSSEKMIKRNASLFFIDINNIENIINSKFLIWFANNIIVKMSNQTTTKIAWIAKNKHKFQIPFNSKTSTNRIFDNHKQATQWLTENIEYEFGKNSPKHKHS